MKKDIGFGAICIWIGFIGAISFMEAWLKFTAPGVTLSIGLGIGRLVFAALNKMEWVVFLTAFISLFQLKIFFKTTDTLLLFAALILIVQTIWLLPALDARAELYITGAAVPPSNLHIYYVAAEGLKMITLLTVAISLLRRKS
ncbi:hypothetical protein [Pedobacter boryungensis]|uniref:DUF4149 domain-containing protein n=1 Tax=Pedobacter boryungensis TaxID=869962 RepID=A0ABX2DCD1_9SPHI|nr:hypothetical protein [Pedobacter boryungensis]NQX31605.1 hypothetical protein [Pedobacter boryungensis]